MINNTCIASKPTFKQVTIKAIMTNHKIDIHEMAAAIGTSVAILFDILDGKKELGSYHARAIKDYIFKRTGKDYPLNVLLDCGDHLKAQDNDMIEVRCASCYKQLGKINGTFEIRCTRCKHITTNIQ